MSCTRRDRGAAMVEAAIILPILLMLIFGIIEFGRAYNAKNTLNQASREGVRKYALTQDFAQGEAAAKHAATSLDPNDLTVTATACNPGDPTELEVSYPFSYEIPFVGSRSFAMTSKAVMRCGG